METEKKWLVTGAAHGLGLATIKYLLSRQQMVIAIAEDTTRLDQDLPDNPLLDTILLDPTNEAQLAQLSDYLSVKYGMIDRLVNTTSTALRLIHYLLPLIRTNDKGHLIDFSITPSYNESLSVMIRRKAAAMGIKVTAPEQKCPVFHFSFN
ncbi:SDR family NAD(P)-dependent oxidoreductase [Spirosoma sp. KNUC1025]|uniref:SDR family NAD(P)-dependent oxidoreductase n=1 Tax=Spirosoma sp. KNUC1025 TaxID=2894082 RepID=UPI00386DA2D5|nr:SDR family NAD(P)-dependent oxidoreductase [Spirosoma sp. KNUC1025]